jgi:NADH-quinone oxidoreductase subunit C
MSELSVEAITDAFRARCGDGVVVEAGFGPTSVDVPPGDWLAALRCAHDDLGLTYFDWLSAVDEADDGMRVVAHVARVAEPAGSVEHLLLRTLLPPGADSLASATEIYRGARWHERETYEMFGITFDGHPNLVPLLLPDGFEGRPLRKSFVLATRVAKPWPGAKEPGESEHSPPAGGRRRNLPPGIPDPSWGPRPAGGDDD